MATLAQLAEKARQDRPRSPSPSPEPPRGSRPRPPPLPPRQSSIQAPPPYTSDDARRSELISKQWRSDDPRSSSTHSLVPSESGRDGRRTLLLVYVHGFMGNETSFQSFPAHVHNLLTITLAETHAVHTKIYPRYKSRKAIDFARDDFSTWLEPHENRHTDVILLGHSMGGILSAEVALQPPTSPATGRPFRHRILGTINFDTPFLGMHPGVVISGIGSLFRPAPDPPGSKQARAPTNGTSTPSMDSQGSTASTIYAASNYTPSSAGSEASSQLSLVQSITSPLASPQPNDPFYNPPFPNDVRLPERKGWTNILHFINKHSDGLTSATKQYFMSHLEFGGCLADYPGLKNRYEKLRYLEDVDELAQREGPGHRPSTRRIRFINYYTASTGRPAAPKIPPDHVMDKDGNLTPIEVEMREISLNHNGSPSSTPGPSISVDQTGNGTKLPQILDEGQHVSPVASQMQDLGENSGVQNDLDEPPPMRHIDSMPIPDEEESFSDPPPAQAVLAQSGDVTDEPTPKLKSTPSEPPLPPLPAIPTEPVPLDLSAYTDKDSRKLAEKEQKRVTKVYQQAVKDRESAIKDRKKLLEKREKVARQEQERALKADEKQRLKNEKEEEKRNASINPQPANERRGSTTSSVQDNKPKRDKKFCMLPPEYGGKRDKCWIRVYMEGVDEVGAHCGLFFPGPQYESLVGDVGARIEKWVQEDATRVTFQAEGTE